MIIAHAITENGETILRTGAAGYEIIVDGQFLMSSASGGSSCALIEYGLELLPEHKNTKVLIAGLGLGFSLQTALAAKKVHEVTVVEIDQTIIDWHTRDTIPGTAMLLKDPRTRIIHHDFVQYIMECREKYDLIATDIDNGPEWLSHESNHGLYTDEALQQIKQCLSPEGVASFWSADVSPILERSLAGSFETLIQKTFEDHNGEGRVISAFIYLAK